MGFDVKNCVELFVIKRQLLEKKLKIFFIMFLKISCLILLSSREMNPTFHFNILTNLHHFNLPDFLQIRSLNMLPTSEAPNQEQWWICTGKLIAALVMTNSEVGYYKVFNKTHYTHNYCWLTGVSAHRERDE